MKHALVLLFIGLPSVALAAGDAIPAGVPAEDWANIRAAYDASRHAAVAVPGGHRARNPGQRWTTLFDGRGFTTTPDVGGWSWGLDLEEYGWEGDERCVRLPPTEAVDSARVAYEWDEQLTEWYVNGSNGLEQGFTVLARPHDARGRLTLRLAIRGGLHPEVSENGRDVRFADAEGRVVLVHAGLRAFDATGRELDAGWQMQSGRLLLSVDDVDARYPLTIDPIAQQAYLKASNTDQGDNFGWSVAASGNTVVVGAPGEDSDSNGVNGSQGEGASGAGAAYVFVREATVWSQQAYLKSSFSAPLHHFGGSVAISGDTIVVGAGGENSGSTGVNGVQFDSSAMRSGAAYVFVRSGTSWAQQAYLKASNTGAGDGFGVVSISGETIVVGAALEDSAAPGVNGDQSDNSVADSGAAYVFVRSGTTWSQQAYLKASNPGFWDSFGSSVSVSGDTIVVGAPNEESNATGIDGDQNDSSLPRAGAAYVFARSGTAWSQQAYVKASNTAFEDLFGHSVSVSGDTVVVGAYGEDSDATGVNGDPSNDLAVNSGAAYVFVRGGTSWSQQAYLKASNTGGGTGGGDGDQFGYSVSISGEALLIGASGEGSPATGVNGTQGDAPQGIASGAAYAFARNGTTWSQAAYLKASNTGQADRFGSTVSVSDSLVVVGAPYEQSSTVGVNRIQLNDDFDGAGASYVFDLETPFQPGCFPGSNGVLACPCGQPANLSGGCRNYGPGATLGAVLNAAGNPSLAADSIVLTTSNHRTAPAAGVFNIFFTGSGTMSSGVASHAGVRCVSTQLKRLYNASTTAGVVSRPGPGDPSVSARSAALGVTILPGQTRHYFNVYRDPIAAVGCADSTVYTNLTNAGSITWSP